MLHELKPAQFKSVLTHFTPLIDHHLFCAGVLHATIPGRVFVDQPEQPRTALVLKDRLWSYLGGDPDNPPFFAALRQTIQSGELVGSDLWGLLFFVPSEAWLPHLDGLIPDRRTIPTPRHLYLATSEQFNPPPPLPTGFDLLPIEPQLASRVADELPAGVAQVLELRAAAAEPEHVAFGFVALDGTTCAAWSLVDCIVNGRGEVGLETRPAYQRRGLAGAVSGATIAYGLAQGLTAVHWDVVAYNTPSIRLAEKHALQLAHTYNQHLLIFPQISYLANLAWYHLDQKDFDSVLPIAAELISSKNGQKFGHFLTAAALAGLGDEATVFAHLNQAIDCGWDNRRELEMAPTLITLHKRAEWTTLLSRLT